MTDLNVERVAMPHLSPRERQVLILTAEGLSLPEIAERLGVSFHTAKSHSDQVRRRLGVKKRRHLITLAKFYEWPEKPGRVAD